MLNTQLDLVKTSPDQVDMITFHQELENTAKFVIFQRSIITSARARAGGAPTGAQFLGVNSSQNAS